MKKKEPLVLLMVVLATVLSMGSYALAQEGPEEPAA